MATPTQTAAKEARLSARSEQDFADLIAQVLIDERDAEKVVDFLTKLNVPKVFEPVSYTHLTLPTNREV